MEADSTTAAELGLWPTIGLSIFAIAWFGFFIWLMRDMFIAHRVVPKELKGIREALERIADQLENKN